MKNVVQDLTSAGIDWQREKWQSGLGSKFIHQGEKNAAKYADEVIVLSKGVQKYFLETYGRETHFIFPLLGVRFISVNDGYDSGMQIRNDVCGLEVAIKNIINASYSRDLSAKIAAADHVMQKKGMYLGGYRPFGFLPDPSDCHKLILDPVASRYVRLIFELALQGNRTGTIAKILNEKQIPTPAAYHVAENHVYSEQKAWDLQRSHWTSGTVYHVLKNEKYKGTYVGAKFIMPVPCKHRVLRAPLEQQVRIEDSHAAIVTPEEFEQAQKVIMLQHGKHQAGNYTKHQYSKAAYREKSSFPACEEGHRSFADCHEYCRRSRRCDVPITECGRNFY